MRQATIDRETFIRGFDKPLGDLSVEFDFGIKIDGFHFEYVADPDGKDYDTFSENSRELADELVQLGEDYSTAFEDLKRIRERVLEITGVKGSW